MRHKMSGRSFGRSPSHRKATLQAIAVALFEHELIKTTMPKAKELRRLAEPLITRAKVDSVHNRPLAFARLRGRAPVQTLFNALRQPYTARPGVSFRRPQCALIYDQRRVGKEG